MQNYNAIKVSFSKSLDKEITIKVVLVKDTSVKVLWL